MAKLEAKCKTLTAQLLQARARRRAMMDDCEDSAEALAAGGAADESGAVVAATGANDETGDDTVDLTQHEEEGEYGDDGLLGSNTRKLTWFLNG